MIVFMSKILERILVDVRIPEEAGGTVEDEIPRLDTGVLHPARSPGASNIIKRAHK